MDTRIEGIHHVTALAGPPQQNLDFYGGVLGLRLVKTTVNFDDPGTYHFYFGDPVGSPGTILTFFPWPGASRGRIGNGQVTATSFRAAKGSLDAWQERLAASDADVAGVTERLGEHVLSFRDPDGLQLEIVEWDGESHTHGPDVLHGFSGVTLELEQTEWTMRLLVETLDFIPVGEERDRLRFRAPGEGPGVVFDLVRRPGARRGSVGVGVVHHVALRVPDENAQQAWRERLIEAGLHVTEVADRTYFRSIYFREPGGVLFELATDAPGFLVDEPEEALGDALMLPPWLEPRRAEIERRLPPIERRISVSSAE
jgi:glyoxalase family protein